MHGSVSGYVLVNAEVDSMGGVIDSGGGGIGLKTSPTAIEKAQAELRYFSLRPSTSSAMCLNTLQCVTKTLLSNRQEYDVREERRRELEFLEKV